MLLVGLTGGIGAGKSTVAAVFAAEGAAVVDADALAREVVVPGSPALRAMVERFGTGILDSEGGLHRRRLAREVFGDAVEREALEAILHPAIIKASQERFVALAGQGFEVVVYEAALLVEAGRQREMDLLVVVTAPDVERVSRLMARDGLDEEQVKRRLAAQMSQEKKAALADFVIHNAGAREALRAKVQAIWQQISMKRG
ncbi:MAG: dephospho-CoA kinase [Deltaproteobacteria bacterium]|nr:dephospho-CoA kinase [Deltaproteobacteria bacterium]